jgi:hypothetical protein
MGGTYIPPAATKNLDFFEVIVRELRRKAFREEIMRNEKIFCLLLGGD